MFVLEKNILKVSEFFDTGLVTHGFSTRHGGVSSGMYESMNFRFNCDDTRENVIKNFEIFCSSLGIDYKNLVLTNQVHEDNVLIVGKKDCGNGIMYPNKFKSADALITCEREVPLAVFYADCVPVMFLDKKKRVIGVAHSGWKGTYAEITKKTAEKMKDEFSSDPSDIIAAIGPSIMDCHYEVSEELYESFYEKFGASVITKKDGRFMLSLQKIIDKQLAEVGVTNRIFSDICTYCQSDTFFSHRKTNGNRGVMAGIIELLP